MQKALSQDTPTPDDPVVEVAKAAGDERRANLLRVLEHDSFSVSELAQVFSVAQPAISHHLKILREAGLVSQRREGNSNYYRRRDPADSALIRELFKALDGSPAPVNLRRKVAAVHRAREKNVRAFFASNADALKSQRMLISEPGEYAESMQEIWRTHLPVRGRALEIGPGNTRIIERLAEDFGEITAIDRSAKMLAPVRAEAIELTNVRIEENDLSTHSGPQQNLVVAAMVVHHQTSPRAFFAAAAARLAPGGMLLIAELDRHQHDWATEACGDLWLGFTPEELDGWAESVGMKLATRQFFAQRNGFTIQLASYLKSP